MPSMFLLNNPDSWGWVTDSLQATFGGGSDGLDHGGYTPPISNPDGTIGGTDAEEAFYNDFFLMFGNYVYRNTITDFNSQGAVFGFTGFSFSNGNSLVVSTAFFDDGRAYYDVDNDGRFETSGISDASGTYFDFDFNGTFETNPWLFI